jgi:diaminopimelate epimerase
MMLSKYSANGNDFVIFHALEKKDRSALALELCDRQNGVGADGLIVLVPHGEYDFEWEFYNSDGSYAEMCGNGSRACAHYAYINDIASKEMDFLTGAGVINAKITKAHGKKKAMVLSELTPPEIIKDDIVHNGSSWWLINTGVPHLVKFVDDIEEFDIDEARELRYEHNANVNIVKVNKDNTLHVRTYERGVEDETLACGTGMAACFYRALKEQKIDGDVKVYPKSGDTLYLGQNTKTITFEGEVVNTFNTEWR